MTGPIEVQAAARLFVLEQTIEAGMSSFVLVGEALLEVRDQRLYRLNYPTFEAYCENRWGFKSSRARQYIAAAEVATAIASVTAGNGPTTERQARALVPILREKGPDAAAAVLAEAQSNGHASAASITAMAHHSEEPPIDASMWDALVAVIDAIEGLAGRDASDIAATVPARRRAATAKRLRKLGTYLGRIAWTLEGEGTATT